MMLLLVVLPFCKLTKTELFNKMPSVKLIVENNLKLPLLAEHGLAMLLEYGGKKFLFDTGATSLILKNAEQLRINFSDISAVILSHGHNDHSGGLAHIPTDCKVYASPDIYKTRFSIHKDVPIRNISMPTNSVEKLMSSNWQKIDSFSEIYDGIFLTGPIPRLSDEDTGGPFFLDSSGNDVDTISDEQALLFASGVLVQGCCHSGIINTLEYCKKCRPNVAIHTIIGGLHLVNATHERLSQTAEYLNNCGVKKLYALHCTGQNAIEFLSEKCPNVEIFDTV